MLRLQDAQPNAWQGRLRQQWRQIPAKGCRVGRREGSHDAAARVQARKRPKYAAIAAARASTSPSAPDLELTDGAG